MTPPRQISVPAGYKQTEAGVIPEEWEVSSVGCEFDIKLGKMLDAEKNVGVPKPYLGNKAVQWDRIDIRDLPMVPMSRADIERFRLRKGDLLVCEGGEVGRAAIWEAPLEECYYQKALHRLRPTRGFNVKVMAALLRQWSDHGQLTNYVTQTSIAHLPREKFMEVPMLIPPPPEQRAIAEALSDVDGLLGALERLIAKKRDLKQAAMQQLLTGQTRLPGFGSRKAPRHHSVFGAFPIDWELLPLSQVSAFITKGSTPTTYGFDWVSSGVLFLRSECVSERGLDLSESMFVSSLAHQLLRRSEVKPNDILMTITGNVGRVVHLNDNFPPSNINQHIARIRITDNRVASAFVFHFLSQPLVRKYYNQITTGQAYPQISLTQVRDTVLPMPSLAEQTAIAAVLKDMDAELTGLVQRREKTRTLKQGMMQELLTGRTRLV